MSFRLVPKAVTLNDLERLTAPLHCFISHNRVDLWRNLCTSLLYFVVRVRCRRKDSSRSLSHLLMSFLLNVVLPLFTSGYGAVFQLSLKELVLVVSGMGRKIKIWTQKMC